MVLEHTVNGRHLHYVFLEAHIVLQNHLDLLAALKGTSIFAFSRRAIFIVIFIITLLISPITPSNL